MAKVDAVTKANIANINDLTVPSGAPFTGLLDETYGSGATAAYSVRRLASATTVLLRVRRDTGGATGDDDEADVRYDSNNELSLDSVISNTSVGVTASTLGQFINVGTVGGTTYTNPDSLTVTASCYVDTWYDQASTNDAEQTAHASQPQIHGGTVNTDLIQENSKPALDFSGGQRLQSSNFTGPSTHTNFLVATPDESTTNKSPVQTASSTIAGGTDVLMRFSSAAVYRMYATSFLDDGSYTANTQYLAYALFQNSAELALNGATATTGSITMAAMETICVGAKLDGSLPMDGTIQEVVIFSGDKSGNRTDIETNINTEFSVF